MMTTLHELRAILLTPQMAPLFGIGAAILALLAVDWVRQRQLDRQRCERLAERTESESAGEAGEGE